MSRRCFAAAESSWTAFLLDNICKHTFLTPSSHVLHRCKLRAAFSVVLSRKTMKQSMCGSSGKEGAMPSVLPFGTLEVPCSSHFNTIIQLEASQVLQEEQIMIEQSRTCLKLASKSSAVYCCSFILACSAGFLSGMACQPRIECILSSVTKPDSTTEVAKQRAQHSTQ